ncbi:MAG: histidine--tRNA ligase [Actinomycetota bacterium]
MPERPKAPRGTYDLLPPDSELLTEIEDVARTLFDRYGYRRIEVPIFEHTELFERTVGEGSDVVVQKQMYTFPDARGRMMTLRPEGTAGTVRAFLDHRPDKTLGSPVRLYYIGPMFRYERPAKGVDRQYVSVGVENIGSASPLLDAEVIVLGSQFFDAFGLKPQLLLNTLGCPNDRVGFVRALREALADHIDEMCDDCHRRLESNPMRVFDCKVPADKKIVRAHAPVIREYICAECKEHHASVERTLESLGVRWTDDPYLVRGLDYYTRTVFEFVEPDIPALGGGGRYDVLVEQLGGPPTPALGFGFGVSRLMLALRGHREPMAWRPAVHVVWLGDVGALALATAIDLRNAGLRVTLSDEARSMRSQLREADRLGAAHALILGPDEVSRRAAKVKDMTSGEEREVPFERLVEELSA